MSFNIEIEGGKSVRLPTAGKYCEQDIVVTATGGDATATAFLDLKKTITEYRDDTITKLPQCAFCGCTNLKKVVLPAVTDVNGQELFEDCPNLAVVDFTALTILGAGSLDEWGMGDFEYTSPIPASVKALVNRGGLFQMGAIEYEDGGFVENPSCGIQNNENTYVYVPRSCISEENFRVDCYDDGVTIYKTTYGADWNPLYTANRIRAIEDYTVDGTVTGELDFAKMGIS